ncbi:hypothetical protein [Absidia glauca]|uniref:Uncharacterized protein n=1 Tax=Absidia glauca TaxID=4829 RepID=A0A168MEX4_ABSGL|nr:hypothetical protein [Absidia glauca]
MANGRGTCVVIQGFEISTIQKSIEWQDKQTGKAFKDSTLLAQVPIFQLVGLPRPNKDHPVYDSISSYLRRFEKIMEIHQVDPDVNWKLYLTYAMAGDDVDVWFSNNLKPLDVTWLEARKLLLEKFSNKDRRIDSTMELFCLKMDPAKESVMNSLAITAFSLSLSLLGLPKSVSFILSLSHLAILPITAVAQKLSYLQSDNKHSNSAICKLTKLSSLFNRFVLSCLLKVYLLSLVRSLTESYTEFGLRLQHLCHGASWKNDLTTAMLCLRALPRSLKENVLMVYHSRSNKHGLPQTAEEVLKIASKLAKQRDPFYIIISWNLKTNYISRCRIMT